MNRIHASPTGAAGGFGFIIGVMWYVGTAQGNGVAYLLCFMLLAVLLVSVPKSFLNLTGLKITAESPKPAFAGQEISLPVELLNGSRRARCAVSVSLSGGECELVDEIAAGLAARTVIRFPARRRGVHEVSSLTLASVYPLGFLKAWRKTAVSQQYVVYPAPLGDRNFPAGAGNQGSASRTLEPEGDDFAGVRPYLPGEAQRHIDWKAVARGHPLMVKQFARDQGGPLHFDFGSVPQSLVEARLSQLALWVIAAERARRPYGLRLPAVEIPASNGETHYHQCMRALACH